MRKIWIGVAVALSLAGSARAADPAAAPGTTSIVLASTTSVDNSGLLAAILPEFTKTTGVAVKVLALGTGQALDTARRGDADIVLVHDPEAEQKFLDDGNGVSRKQIAWNDFILVGPQDDPAHIAGGHDAKAALAAIAGTKAPFVSRGDRSGTNALELRLWKQTGLDPKAGAGTWYRDIGGGMGAALNRYDVIELNPATHPGAKLAPAHWLAVWLTTPPGQEAIGAYKLDGETLFHPSAADPK